MTDREKKLNTDREWLADELMRAGSPALPSSLSAVALFERMDAEEQRAAESAAPAPEKKAETAEPLPAPEYPADYTPPVKNKPQSREWC